MYSVQVHKAFFIIMLFVLLCDGWHFIIMLFVLLCDGWHFIIMLFVLLCDGWHFILMLFVLLCVMVGILLTRGKRLHDHIISLRGEFFSVNGRQTLSDGEKFM